ncbi:hypothetical protein [Paraburkholderia phosphatilytica]|uniref:hypothetical protein n=1 Tax=Paraburkholderia phosphatilytica TaxID=2282883 RepID=UPI000E4E77B5|nr:hypothetical protein [Paraburkholderia phosphatilytica]
MARPRIGIFGALVAVGGVLAWRWSQKHRVSQTNLNREINRWEDEGGAVVASPQTAPSHGPAMSATEHVAGAAGTAAGAWPFPHGDDIDANATRH